MNTGRLAETLDEITHVLRSMARSGWDGFDCSHENLARIATWGTDSAAGKETLAHIRLEMGDCGRCGLSRSRNKIVFGAGNPAARLVFIGEAPGREEDLQGEPFVGAAGQLLSSIIQAMALTRDQVYICNVIKCRPPGNRNPSPDEIQSCSPFLERQIDAIAPQYICTLGKFATQTLLSTDRPISGLRGRFYEYRGMKLIPTFHPAYLLHNPDKKRAVWEDMKKLMAAMKESEHEITNG